MDHSVPPVAPVKVARARSPYRTPFLLSIGALLSAVVTIVLGAMTTSTGSGMAFLDWPLAHGQIYPANMNLPEWLEYGHRAVAATTGLFSLILVIWALASRQRLAGQQRIEPWRLKLAVGILGVVIAQGLLGGIGVLKNQPLFLSASHGILAQLTLSLLAFACYAFSRDWHQTVKVPAGASRVARRLTAWTMGIIILQLTLGAFGRHSGSQAILWTHVGFALIVALLIMVTTAYLGGRHAAAPGIRRVSHTVLALLLLQIVLGFVALAVFMDKNAANIEFLWRCTLRTSHVFVGALLMTAVALMCFRAFRVLQPDSREGGPA